MLHYLALMFLAGLFGGLARFVPQRMKELERRTQSRWQAKTSYVSSAASYSPQTNQRSVESESEG